MNEKKQEMWKKKLVAFMHDPPHKPRNIQDHEEQRKSYINRVGISEGELLNFNKYSDFQAAAADRLIFPEPGKSGLKVDWEESFFEFRHPLCGEPLSPKRFPKTSAVMEETCVSALDGITPETTDWRLKYIRVWRLFPERGAREKNPHFAYIVADTRIPDHTIWQHNSLAAAFESLGENKPAFMLFQIGPVQDFIKQARKLQDLWSGSYILSYLIAQAIIAVAEELGPDNIIYPQVRGTPLIDLHWHKRGYIDNPLHASHSNELLVPNLPNRFLALVPAGEEGAKIAKMAKNAVRKTWKDIADSVRQLIIEEVGKDYEGWDAGWDNQVSRFPVVDWVIHEWSDVETAIRNAERTQTPPMEGEWKACPLNHAYKWAMEVIPPNEREDYDAQANSAFAWMLHYAITDWKFAARKNARSFSQWVEVGKGLRKGSPKDYLDGKNEVLGGSRAHEFWEKMRSKEAFQYDFPGSQVYGAITVIKRLWSKAYLENKLGWQKGRPSFESIQDIADGLEEGEAGKVSGDKVSGDKEGKNIYYAVLTMDGDGMGKWVSGANAPALKDLLADKAREYFEKHWKEKGDKKGLPDFDKIQRPLSPGYHAALSEALSNFSLYCAGPIVEAFKGQLIYSGGDDVLAILPAKVALDCAQALQIAFRGLHPDDPRCHASQKVKEVLKKVFYYENHVDGFVVLNKEAGNVGRGEHLRPNYPLMVMGPRATISAGIAIGHVHDPMQDTIEAARQAEKMAKDLPGKGGFAVSILKRSGEATTFRARWESGAPAVWSELFHGGHNLSEGFAYKYAGLVKELITTGGSAEGAEYVVDWEGNYPRGNEKKDSEEKSPEQKRVLREAVKLELVHTLQRQGNMDRKKATEIATLWCSQLIGDSEKTGSNPSVYLSPRDYLHFWLSYAFIKRISKSSKEAK